MCNEYLGKVTKYELNVLWHLAMAQEKPEGGLFAPPPLARNSVKKFPWPNNSALYTNQSSFQFKVLFSLIFNVQFQRFHKCLPTATSVHIATSAWPAHQLCGPGGISHFTMGYLSAWV